MPSRSRTPECRLGHTSGTPTEAGLWLIAEEPVEPLPGLATKTPRLRSKHLSKAFPFLLMLQRTSDYEKQIVVIVTGVVWALLAANLKNAGPETNDVIDMVAKRTRTLGDACATTAFAHPLAPARFIQARKCALVVQVVQTHSGPM
jgi:hypothetical protein